MIPTREQNPDGFHQRYIIHKADGSPVDPNAIYLVLRLDDNGRDHEHVNASRAAAMMYAVCAPKRLQKFANELISFCAGFVTNQ